MTGKEFAEKYAGRIVRKRGHSEIRGRVVAYHTGVWVDRVTIESPTIVDSPNRNYGDGRVWVVVPARGGWNEMVDTLELIDTPGVPTPKDYPHKCPKCSAPAYIGFTSVKCSQNCKGGK